MVKKYAKTHEWIEEKESGIYHVGISDHAQELLGDVVFVELPSVGDSFSKDDEIGVVESVKAASNIYAPVSGEIVAVNQELENSPDLINSAAESDGWICTMKISHASELDQLDDQDHHEEV